MARIAGITLPEKKRVDVGLTAIYGIGRKNALAILTRAKIEPAKRVAKLTAEEVTRLARVIDKLPVEGALKKQVGDSIKRLKLISAYRGIRHNQNLPVRGQRTRSNARTKRGKRRTVGAMKKKDATRLETGAKTETSETKGGKK